MDRRIRVRTGCATCRRRRVKCDEAKPSCNRCRTANFVCAGYDAPRSSHSPIEPSLVTSKRSSTSKTSNDLPLPTPQDLSWRHVNWRQEQLPLYHHFVTITAVRLFRCDHLDFWRDQVAQMSFSKDLVHEALLATGALHRSGLVSCHKIDQAAAANLKVLGLKAYGKALRLLPSHLGQNSVADILAILAVLVLLAYVECFMENPKGTFRHLWAAIQLLRSTEPRLSSVEASSMAPLYDAILRLDFLAQKLVPYSSSSFLRHSDHALLERPFWNRPSLQYSGICPANQIAAEGYRQIQLICGHNNFSRVVWGCWCPAGERPSRDELLAFRSEMQLWATNSPATYQSCEDLDMLQSLDPNATATYQMSPPPVRFLSNDAAMNVATANCYLGCTVAMLSTTEPDPAEREAEAYKLVYQTMCIAAGLLDNRYQGAKPYKPCDAVNMGISTLLFLSARRCYSLSWQQWIIAALRAIGREGLSNGLAFANVVEIMCQIQARMHAHDPEWPADSDASTYLGPVSRRVIPLLMPLPDDGECLAFYLRYGNTELDDDERAIQVVAKASWRQDDVGAMQNMQLEVYDTAISDELILPVRPKAEELFQSWRGAVEKGWHGYLALNTTRNRDGLARMAVA